MHKQMVDDCKLHVISIWMNLDNWGKSIVSWNFGHIVVAWIVELPNSSVIITVKENL